MPGQPRQNRWKRFFRRAAIGLLFAFVAIFIPCANWTPEVFANWQVPIVVLALILYLGVLIVDTMFFDRYY